MRVTPRHILPFVLSLLVIGAAGSARGAEVAPLMVEDVPTNLGLAHRMAREVAGKSLDALALPAGDCLRFVPAAEHPGNGILELALADAGRERGLRVVEGEGACGRNVEFSILELRIAYTGVDRSALWTRKEIERHGACVLAARLLDAGTGEERRSTQQEVVMADRVPYALKELVGSSSYPFTAPELDERDWSKSAEPFVVTGMIAALVYLFFSNQSGN